MANITAADVKKLRDATGAGMMDCKKALDRGRRRLRQGRRDPARQGRRPRPTKRGAERTATNGLVAAAGRRAASSSNCETDFVAKNERVPGRSPADIADAAAASQAGRRRGRSSGRARRRPDRRRGGRATLAVKIGEKIELGRVARLRRARSRPTCTGAPPTCRPPVGVLVEYEGDDADAARGAAMQIAAMRPQYVTPRRGPGRRRSRTSARSPRRPPARRASRSRRCPRSSRAGSTASSRTSCCSSSRRCSDTKKTVKARARRGRRDRDAVRPLRGRPALSTRAADRSRVTHDGGRRGGQPVTADRRDCP